MDKNNGNDGNQPTSPSQHHQTNNNDIIIDNNDEYNNDNNKRDIEEVYDKQNIPISQAKRLKINNNKWMLLRKHLTNVSKIIDHLFANDTLKTEEN